MDKILNLDFLKSLASECRASVLDYWNISSYPPPSDSDNATGTVDQFVCAEALPRASYLFQNLPPGGYVLYAFLLLSCLATLAIYIEEVIFVVRNFQTVTRKRKTIWILAFFPIFSITGLIGVFVPRAGTLVDMVANVFFGTCLYNFGRLMTDYMGGAKRMWTLIEDNRKLRLNTMPVCCCCICLPVVTFTRKTFFHMTVMIMQVAIVRPILMFFAAVMWADGAYYPGTIDKYDSYVYITVMNLLSTLIAIYGLMLLRGVLHRELEKQFAITGKIASLQATLICSVLPNLFLSILVTTGVIGCSAYFPSKGRSEAIYHTFLVFLMLPFSLVGRKFYRRKQDGTGYAESQLGTSLSPYLDPTPTSLNYEDLLVNNGRPSSVITRGHHII